MCLITRTSGISIPSGSFPEDSQHPFQGSSLTSATDVGGMAIAIYAVMWAYSGWSELTLFVSPRHACLLVCFSLHCLCPGGTLVYLFVFHYIVYVPEARLFTCLFFITLFMSRRHACLLVCFSLHCLCPGGTLVYLFVFHYIVCPRGTLVYFFITLFVSPRHACLLVCFSLHCLFFITLFVVPGIFSAMQWRR